MATADLKNASNEIEMEMSTLSPSLSLVDTTLIYRLKNQTWSFDFSKVYFRNVKETGAHLSLADSALRISTALALVNRVVRHSKTGYPEARALTRQIYLLRHAYDWLSKRGISFLNEATSADLNEMSLDYTTHGWAQCLDIEKRWIQAISLVGQDEIEEGFHYCSQGGTRKFDAINQEFWRPRLGWGGVIPVTPNVREAIERRLKGSPTSRWRARICETKIPRSNVVRNNIQWMNSWFSLWEDCDKPATRLAMNADAAAKRTAINRSKKTADISLTDAAKILRGSVGIIDEISPLLIELLLNAKKAPTSAAYLSPLQKFLENSPIRADIENKINREISRWLWSGTHARSDTQICVDHLIAAVQSACFVIIAAMNGRRGGEVCDVDRGLRLDSLKLADDKLGIYKVEFFIEKTYFERQEFFVNRLTAKAIRCLVELKKAANPEGKSMHPSLFSTYRWSSKGAVSREVHLSFDPSDRRTRTLRSMHALLEPGLVEKLPTSHMYRRFFALIYFYRYENSDLLCLKQHLRHMSVAMTKTYVTTDDGSFLTGSQINLLGFSKDRAPKLTLADFESVQFDKLVESIDSALNDPNAGGGFTRLIRSLYKKMSAGVQQASHKKIAVTLNNAGYTCRPLSYGQCYAKTSGRSLGNCRNGGLVDVSQASPALCLPCPYHFTSPKYLVSLEQMHKECINDLKNLSSDLAEAKYLKHQENHLKNLILKLKKKEF